MVERFIITASSMAKPCHLLVIHIPIIGQFRHAQVPEIPQHYREPAPLEAKRQADPVPERARARRRHVPPRASQLQSEATVVKLVHLRAAENNAG